MKIFLRLKILMSFLLLSFTNAMAQSEFNLEKMVLSKDSETGLMELDSYLNKKCAFGDSMQLLNEAQKIFILIENLESEINNGGFNQFYWNSSGNFAVETVEALKQIGAEYTAEIVKRANAQFPDSKVPSSRSERQMIMDEIEDQAEGIWDELDNDYYEYQDNISDLLMAFVLKNRTSFEN